MLNRVLLLSLCPALWRILLALKFVYIRGTQRLQFKIESYLRRWLCDTRYALRTRNTYQLAMCNVFRLAWCSQIDSFYLKKFTLLQSKIVEVDIYNKIKSDSFVSEG